MEKRGQSTTFILLGLIILVIVIGLSLTSREVRKTARGEEIGKAVSLPPHIRPVYDYVQGCVKDNSRTGIYLLGLQGGYIEPSRFLETDLTKVAYGYYLGQKTLASKETMSNELDKFIGTMVPKCTDFSNFKDLTIKGGKVSSRLFINTGSVSVEAYYPLEIERSGSIFKLNEKYSVSYPIRFGKVYDFASKVIDKEIEDPGKIDLTYLLESGFDVTILPVDDNNVIYSISDKESTINNLPFVFMFANRF